MRSNVCKIEKGTRDLAAILKECQKVAVYNELTEKQAFQLRLLCEELDGMLPNIIDDFNGDFWIDYVDGACRINVSVELEEFTAEKKEALIGVAKNKKNAAAVGFVGKIRSALESVFLDEEALRICAISTGSLRFSAGCSEGVDYAYLWSLEQYRTVVTEEKSEDWDELEKSVIASIADDVIIGVRGKQADIIIVKNFA